MEEHSMDTDGQPTSTRPRRASVLVAEDDDDLRAMVVAALRADGFDVSEARSGAELLDRITTALLGNAPHLGPDIIVSDIRMPGLTGIEIAAGLRAARWETPIILMTAYSRSEAAAEAKRAGVRDVFTKPFDIDDLRTAVLNAVSRSRRR